MSAISSKHIQAVQALLASGRIMPYEGVQGSVFFNTNNRFENLLLVLNNKIYNLLGFNCSLFAYGQTGAGKSYSMVGYGPNK